MIFSLFIFPGLSHSIEVRVYQTKSKFFEGENITLECYSNLTECNKNNTSTIWLKRRWGPSLIVDGETKKKLNLTLKMLDTGYYSCEIQRRISAEFFLRVQGLFCIFPFYLTLIQEPIIMDVLRFGYSE